MALKTEKVYSQIEDKNIKIDVLDSIIWKNCEHPDDVDKNTLSGWFEYTIKFDGVTPVQCTKVKKIK